MTDPEVLKWAASLGVGGILAGVIFGFYRRDFLRERKEARDERDKAERREDRLLIIIERNATASEHLAGTIENLGDIFKERRLEHQQQMEALQRLPGLVAHELRGIVHAATVARALEDRDGR